MQNKSANFWEALRDIFCIVYAESPDEEQEDESDDEE